MTDIVPYEEARDGDEETILILRNLELAGAISSTHLELTNPDMSYSQWESMGRFFGRIGTAYRWWIGDWLLFGEAIFGEAYAQGVEATRAERYSEMHRVTRLDKQTLMNIASVCKRVARPRRREELPFWIHQEVASLDPDDQTMWLQAALDNSWGLAELRRAIRGKSVDPDPVDNDGGDDTTRDSGIAPPAVRIKMAGLEVVRAASVNSDGDWVVPAQTMAQLAAALGEELA